MTSPPLRLEILHDALPWALCARLSSLFLQLALLVFFRGLRKTPYRIGKIYGYRRAKTAGALRGAGRRQPRARRRGAENGVRGEAHAARGLLLEQAARELAREVAHRG